MEKLGAALWFIAYVLVRWYEALMRSLWWIPNTLTLARLFYIAPAIFLLFLWEWAASSPIAAFLMVLAEPWVLLTAPPHPGLYFNYLNLAFWLTFIGVTSDYVDGLLAKTFARYGWQTEYGKYFDPYADKALGLSVLFSIPLHYGVGWYLLVYLPVGRYIIFYSRTTTQMRKKKLIDGASKQAQLKTALQMFVKVAFMFDIAWASTLPETTRTCIFGVALACFAFSALMCRWSLREYTEQAKRKVMRPVAAE